MWGFFFVKWNWRFYNKRYMIFQVLDLKMYIFDIIEK